MLKRPQATYTDTNVDAMESKQTYIYTTKRQQMMSQTNMTNKNKKGTLRCQQETIFAILPKLLLLSPLICSFSLRNWELSSFLYGSASWCHTSCAVHQTWF